MNKDVQLINEAYGNMPPQVPQHLLEEGMMDQLNVWVVNQAIPWLKKNKYWVAGGAALVTALATYMNMDPDTAQGVVDGLDPEVLGGVETATGAEINQPDVDLDQSFGAHDSGNLGGAEQGADAVAGGGELSLQDAMPDGYMGTDPSHGGIYYGEDESGKWLAKKVSPNANPDLMKDVIEQAQSVLSMKIQGAGNTSAGLGFETIDLEGGAKLIKAHISNVQHAPSDMLDGPSILDRGNQ